MSAEKDSRQAQEKAELGKVVESQSQRKIKAEKEQASLAAQTIYLGVLGFLLVLPIVAGAYLGKWLDDKLSYFSLHWTLSMIILGVFVGVINVYLFIREK